MAGCSLIHSKQCLKNFHSEWKKQNEQVLFGEVDSFKFSETQYFFSRIFSFTKIHKLGDTSLTET